MKLRTPAIVTASLLALSLLSPATAHADPDPANGFFDIVNAGNGIFWRNSPHWADTDHVPGHGVYNGDTVYIECWAYGDPVGPYGNTLWYDVLDMSHGQNADGNYPEGWVNDHFLDTPGTAANPQPYGLGPC